MKNFNDMIEFGGVKYYFDADALDKAICTDKNWKDKKITEKEVKAVYDGNGVLMGTEVYERISDKQKEIDATKYDLLRICIEIVIDYNDEDADDTLGHERALQKTPLSYKIAFNTLITEGILKLKEE